MAAASARPRALAGLDLVVGGPLDRRLDERIINGFLAVIPPTCGAALFTGDALGMGQLATVVIGAVGALYCLVYVGARRRLLSRTALYSIVSGTLLPALLFFWLHLGGSQGGASPWVFVALLIPVLIADARRQLTGLLLQALFIASLFALETRRPDLIRQPFDHADAALLDVAASTLNAYVVLALVVLLIVRAWRDSWERIEAERERAQRLLHSMVPAAIADRLVEGGEPIADRYPHATVLFADLSGFTRYAESHSPEQLVQFLDAFFRGVDDILESEGLEKVKTIGDAVMAVSGVPHLRSDHAQAAARAALRIQAFAARQVKPHGGMGVRIGLHSGPVIAGVLGRLRTTFDLWGDTVNVASRMESHGVVGRVQISEQTRLLLGRGFRCEPRGLVDIKGKGSQPVWLLSSWRDPRRRPTRAHRPARPCDTVVTTEV